MGTTEKEIAAEARVNADELLVELQNIAGVSEARIVQEPHTKTINGEPVQFGWKVEISGDIGGGKDTEIDAAIASHSPASTTAEAQAAERLAAKLAANADLIAEIKRQLVEEYNLGK